MCRCADARAEPCQKTQLISQAARTCENTDFTTWFPDCGQTLPWGGARPVSIRHFFFCETSFLLYDGNWHCLTWSMAPLCSIFAAVGSFEALPGVSSGPLWVLRDSEPPGVARNAAKTLGSLKSLTLKFKALVLHNLDWAESASKVICNHWDYLYLFVSICGNRLFSSIVMLWDLQGGYGWLQDEHVDWDARAHKREELRFCLMQDFVFFPDSRLSCETHICLHLPTACFSPSNARSNQRREICSCFIDEAVASALFWSVQ